MVFPVRLQAHLRLPRFIDILVARHGTATAFKALEPPYKGTDGKTCEGFDSTSFLAC